MSNNSKKPLEKILLAAIIVCTVGMLIILPVAVIFFPEKVKPGNLAMLLVGIPFLLMGLGCLTNKADRLLGVACTLFGVGMIGTPFFSKQLSSGQGIEFVEAGIYLGGLMLIVAGLGMIIYLCRTLFYKINHCTLEVEAELKFARTENEEGQQMGSYWLEYYYGGRVYTVKDSLPRKNQRDGDRVKIKIDPENPEEIFKSQADMHLIMMPFCVAIAIVGAFLLLFLKM